MPSFVNEGECEYCGLPWDEHRPGVEREITWPCVTAYRAGLAARNAEPEIIAALRLAEEELSCRRSGDRACECGPRVAAEAVRIALAKVRP